TKRKRSRHRPITFLIRLDEQRPNSEESPTEQTHVVHEDVYDRSGISKSFPMGRRLTLDPKEIILNFSPHTSNQKFYAYSILVWAIPRKRPIPNTGPSSRVYRRTHNFLGLGRENRPALLRNTKGTRRQDLEDNFVEHESTLSG